MIPAYSRVRIVSDAYTDQGAPRGTIGHVIEARDGGVYEVEVSDPLQGGMTLAMFAAQEADLQIVEEKEAGSSGGDIAAHE